MNGTHPQWLLGNRRGKAGGGGGGRTSRKPVGLLRMENLLTWSQRPNIEEPSLVRWGLPPLLKGVQDAAAATQLLGATEKHDRDSSANVT